MCAGLQVPANGMLAARSEQNPHVLIHEELLAWSMVAGSGGERGQPGVRDNPNSGLTYQTIEDLNAEGYSTLTDQNQQDVKGFAVWKSNKWRLVFHRSLTNDNANDVQFKQSVLMAIAVWNGSNKELNGQKGIAGWRRMSGNRARGSCTRRRSRDTRDILGTCTSAE